MFSDVPASQHHTSNSPEEDLGSSGTELDSPELSGSRNLASSVSEFSPRTASISGGFYEAVRINLLLLAVNELPLFKNNGHLI
jgi:hypothetical protein